MHFMTAKEAITDQADKQTTEFVEVCGYVIQRQRLKNIFGEPEAIQHGYIAGSIIRIGQKVFSNGRIHFPAGKMGLVVKIGIPFEKGRTQDIIYVWFEGQERYTAMKFKDLEILPIGSLR
ncbi:MAG TPA: hypothetical protein DEF00_00250 [Candidatus Taylorbacteria bacterium]|nr:hypothetical protein [Candidatus Taylorbacteria bacterium]